MIRRLIVAFVAACSVAQTVPASAHFLWLVPNAQTGRVEVYFAESADPDDPELLDRLKGLVVRQRLPEGKTRSLDAQRKDDWLAATPKRIAGTFGLSHEYGVLDRGDDVFLLQYNAKAYTGAPAEWVEFKKGLANLDVVATREGSKLVFEARWKGEPLPGAEFTVDTPDLDRMEGKSDEKGHFAVAITEPGRFAARVKHVEDRAGKRGDKEFRQARHYTTVTLTLGESAKAKTAGLPDLPFGITSFGAAIVDGRVYAVGGNKGGAHSYGKEGQNDELLMLDLAAPAEWKVVGQTPRRQGLAAVAHGGKLYRIGGFEARNAEGEEEDLHSTADFARFDPRSKTWEQLARLPRPRSSHDAVVIGDHLYVVGGWDMQGGEKHWHETALVADLSADPIVWREFDVPFRRRALAAGRWRGKLVAVGGMQQEGGPTRKTSVYDPATKSWSDGPDLLGEDRLGGFGSSAFQAGDSLYVTAYDGSVQRLAADGRSWIAAGQLEHPRFFHRLLAVDDDTLIAIGGAHMDVGKVVETERLPARRAKTATNETR